MEKAEKCLFLTKNSVNNSCNISLTCYNSCIGMGERFHFLDTVTMRFHGNVFLPPEFPVPKGEET